MRRRWNRLVAAFVAIVMAATTTVVLVPIAAVQAAEGPVAVDVDLVDGGVWVTYSNGCIESRAWQLLTDESFDGNFNGPRCAERARSDVGPFHAPRVVRAPLVLGGGERVVALVPTAGGRDYWLVTSAGRVVTGGAAQHLGDLSAFTLNAPVVAAAPTESGGGYYMLSADGGVFSFGDAAFYGSVQGLVDEHVGLGALAANHITAPVVTLATTPAGYWLVSADGTVFPFGDAVYHGSVQDSINTGNQLSGVTRDWVLRPPVAADVRPAREALNEPVIGVVPSGGGTGYQMVAADGGIFNFGVSQFHGSLAGRARSPAVASDVTDTRSGYVILTEDGQVHRFGSVGRQFDPDGRPVEPVAATALPAAECRPQGEQGFPLPYSTTQPIGSFDVGVLLVEFDDYQADESLWPPEALQWDVRNVEQYLEAMSYGQVDVELHVADEWTSVGPFSDAFGAVEDDGTVEIGSEALLDAVLRRAGGTFDFSNRGLGYEAIMLVLPPSLFGNGQTTSGYQPVAADVTVDAVAWVNTTLLPERRSSRYPWWSVAAHELVHLLGLDDLYPYDAAAQQRPAGWRTTSYGLMGFRTYWPWRADQPEGWRTGQITTSDGQELVDRYYNFSSQSAREMLAWHRWRMGWLRANQVVCLAVGDATVDLMPIAQPDNGVAMATVKLTDSRFLVLEHRARIGYDADQLGAHSQNVWYYRVLEDEGVLAYVVDIAVGGGQLPVRLFGENRELRPGDGWILKSGDSVSSTLEDGTTVRLEVTEGPNGSSRVQIATS